MSWISNPSILWNKEYVFQLIPTETMSFDEKFNAITRLIIAITILWFLIKKTMYVIIIGGITIYGIYWYYKNQKQGFTNRIETMSIPNPDTITMPTVENPLMNVLLNEYTENPDRKPAAPSFNPLIEKKINQNVKQQNKMGKEIYKGKVNQFNLDLSMRNFYTTPNTTIPNKQTEFANFCYGDMISSKEGDPFALSRQHPRLGSVIH